MVARRRPRRLTAVLVLAVLAALVATAAPAPASPSLAAAAPHEQSAILFASDGMRPDLVDRFAASGVMPNMRQLIRRGVEGRNGLTQGFPPNTGVGWYSLATGAWPGGVPLLGRRITRDGDSSRIDLEAWGNGEG